MGQVVFLKVEVLGTHTYDVIAHEMEAMDHESLNNTLIRVKAFLLRTEYELEFHVLRKNLLTEIGVLIQLNTQEAIDRKRRLVGQLMEDPRYQKVQEFMGWDMK